MKSLGKKRNPEKICNFYFYLRLETVFPAIKLTLLENWQFNHKLSLPLSSTKIMCLKNYPYNLTKHEIKETSKILVSSALQRIGKNLEVQPTLILKKPLFHLFHGSGKIDKSSQSNIQKSQNLCIEKNVGVANTQKCQF